MVAQTLLGVAYVAYNRVGCHRLHRSLVDRHTNARKLLFWWFKGGTRIAGGIT